MLQAFCRIHTWRIRRELLMRLIERLVGDGSGHDAPLKRVVLPANPFVIRPTLCD